jgi:hypothetical protein
VTDSNLGINFTAVKDKVMDLRAIPSRQVDQHGHMEDNKEYSVRSCSNAIQSAAIRGCQVTAAASNPGRTTVF